MDNLSPQQIIDAFGWIFHFRKPLATICHQFLDPKLGDYIVETPELF